jgi:hypothetical protein
MITLGFSRASAPSAQRIVDASDGRITAVQSSRGVNVNWGRRSVPGAALNPAIEQAVNKHLARTIFASRGVPAPRLFTSDEALAFMCGAEARGEAVTLLGRPDYHTRRQGFWKCSTVGDIVLALEGRGRKRPATHFMEWVDVDREFRVHVFNGKSIRVSEKDFLDEDRKQYLTIKPTVDRRRHIRDAAKEAVAALGLDFGTVDVLADDEQAFVLEVNAAPGLGGSTPRLWAEAFINWKESQ